MKRKRLAVLAVCILVLFAGSGCTSRQYKAKQMIKSMNAKYSDDSFTYVGYMEGFYVVKSEKYPDNPIWVTYPEGRGGCSDTYLGAKYEKQTKKLFTQLIQEAFGENCYVDYYYSPGTLGFFGQEEANLSFEEYVAKEASGIQIYALVNGVPEDCAQTLEKVKKVFSDVSFLGRINFIKESNIVLDESTVDGIIERGDSAVCIDFAKSGSDCYRCEWLIKSIYREEVRELVTQRLEQIFGDDVYVEFSIHTSHGHSTIPSFEEYIVFPENGVNFEATARYSKKNRKEIENELKEAFADVVIDGSICFISDPSVALDAETNRLLGLRKLHAPCLYMNKSDLDTCDLRWGEI